MLNQNQSVVKQQDQCSAENQYAVHICLNHLPQMLFLHPDEKDQKWVEENCAHPQVTLVHILKFRILQFNTVLV